MANIQLINRADITNKFSGKCYQVTGPLTTKDVLKINSLSEKIVLILENTKGQNPDILNRLNKNIVNISVRGGLDYFNKRKFNDYEYIERTLNTPQELASIIRYFEKIERGIRPTWTPTEKCMYVYKALVEDLHYLRKGESSYENGHDISRSLSGVLYGRLVCAGFALVFKEMMDRQGIQCIYQNYQHHHAWNIVKLEGEYRGLDLTWDCSGKKNNQCLFKHFARDEKFYEDSGHDLSRETEEYKCKLVTFSPDKLRAHLSRISNGIDIEVEPLEMINDLRENIKYKLVNEENGISEYIVSYDGKTAAVYIPSNQDLKVMLNKRNIETALALKNGYIGLFRLPDGYIKSNLYTRNDGTTFVIRKTDKVINTPGESAIYEFAYIEINARNGTLRRCIVLSENRLDLEQDQARKQFIANNMLSRGRLETKIKGFNGYLGYIGNNTERYFSENFEKSLNVHR